MIRVSHLCLVFSVGIAACWMMAPKSWAETWTDSTGNFRIDAEYVEVDGKSVVLRKPNGETLKVPIDRLSVESRALAKSMYEMAKAGGSAPATASSAATSRPTVAPQTRELDFTPPVPPTIPPMAPFPENASLQETVDFVLAQVQAGHPEVFWYALPQDIRMTFDSDELRASLVPFIKEQAQTGKPMEEVMLKAIKVLVTKKQFVLNSPLMAQVPPPMAPLVQQGYDPAVGAALEISMLSFASESLQEMTVTQLLDYHGPRIGAHLQSLAKMAPPGMIDQLLSQVSVKQTGAESGTITVPNKAGGTETMEMVNYLGRWIPKDFSEKWQTNKDSLIADMVSQLNVAKQQNQQAAEQAKMAMGMMVGMANGVLDPMLAANSQQEFDQAVIQIAGLMNMARGGGPGGPGGPGRPGPAGGDLNFE